VYHIDQREIAAVTAVLKKGPLSGFVGEAGADFFGGPVVKRFEKKFAKKFKVKHAVSYNSATTALHGAVAAPGIGPGDEVITPALSFTATPNVVMRVGAKPVFVDVDLDTRNVNLGRVESAITTKTKDTSTCPCLAMFRKL
jgi:dTDP-4-amino-4,6-dideoxygalactose transaminase